MGVKKSAVRLGSRTLGVPSCVGPSRHSAVPYLQVGNFSCFSCAHYSEIIPWTSCEILPDSSTPFALGDGHRSKLSRWPWTRHRLLHRGKGAPRCGRSRVLVEGAWKHGFRGSTLYRDPAAFSRLQNGRNRCWKRSAGSSSWGVCRGCLWVCSPRPTPSIHWLVGASHSKCIDRCTMRSFFPDLVAFLKPPEGRGVGTSPRLKFLQ